MKLLAEIKLFLALNFHSNVSNITSNATNNNTPKIPLNDISNNNNLNNNHSSNRNSNHNGNHSNHTSNPNNNPHDKAMLTSLLPNSTVDNGKGYFLRQQPLRRSFYASGKAPCTASPNKQQQKRFSHLYQPSSASSYASPHQIKPLTPKLIRRIENTCNEEKQQQQQSKVALNQNRIRQTDASIDRALSAFPTRQFEPAPKSEWRLLHPLVPAVIRRNRCNPNTQASAIMPKIEAALASRQICCPMLP